jgi:GNAT superfamily N-acetyltransferase
MMQFDAQDRSYRASFPDASFDLVLVDGSAMGRLYVDRGGDVIRVIDIALLPEHRGRGIGTGLLERVLAEAHLSGRAVRLNALRGSRVLALYSRLGFSVRDEDQVYIELECQPAVS